MAADRGESVAFSALYCSNLFEMSHLLMQLRDKKGIRHITAAGELLLLLDTTSGEEDYDSVKYKRGCMKQFFQTCAHYISGEKKDIDLETVIRDLQKKSEWMKNHIRRNEWIGNKEGFEWFNGYYDNKGNAVEGDFGSGVRMTLTGQVFTIMGGVATDEQVVKISEAAKHYLKDDKIGGYRLNTNFGEVKLDMGRLFGFAFGHKENGAMFSHMAVMYSNALYKRGRAEDGYDVLKSIYDLCVDFNNARIYPGIPEYINEKRRGMYHYLTGSASWLLLTVLMEIYGVKGQLGDLMLRPQLLKEQFDGNGQASVTTLFAGRKLNVIYQNSRGAEVGAYRIEAVEIDGSRIGCAFRDGGAVITREVITSLDKDRIHTILVKM
jgi:cellobiose phosphorylase